MKRTCPVQPIYKSNHQSNMIFVITRSSPVKRAKNQVNRATRSPKKVTLFWSKNTRYLGLGETGPPYKNPKKPRILW